MNPKHLHILACPICHSELTLTDELYDNGRIKSGILSDNQGHSFPIIDFIPRFVSPENYASNLESEFRLWHVEADLKDIDVHPRYNGLEGRGTCSSESIRMTQNNLLERAR